MRSALVHVLAVGVLACSYATAIFGQAPATMTPGRVALLANEPPTAETRQKVQAALVNADPLVRATAARVAWAAGIAQIDDALADSLATERDSIAATEKIRALLIIKGAPAMAQIEPHLARAGSTGTLVIAEWQARVQPQGFVRDIAKLIAASENEGAPLADIVGMAARQHPELREQILRAWVGAARPPAWREFVSSGALNPASDGAIFIEALQSSADEIRVATVWQLVRLLGENRDVPVQVIDAATSVAASNTDAWESFGRQLVARFARNAPTLDRADLIQAEGVRHLDLLRVVVSSPQASKAERAAAMVALGENAPPPESRRSGAATRPSDSVAMRVPWAPWPGFLHSLFDETRCPTTSAPQFAAARVIYRQSGIPERVGIDPNTSPACRAAISLLARLSVADSAHEVTSAESGAEWLVLPLEQSVVKCIDRPVSNPARAGVQPDAASRIVPPKKVHDVRPEYPERAMKNRIQGTVVLEAVIGTTGCVGGVHLKQGITPSLDFAALQAVSSWRFTPTLLNHAPVPVILTVTVNFVLQ